MPPPAIASPAMVLAMSIYSSGNATRWNMLVLYIEAACYTDDPENDGPNFAEIARKTHKSADTTSRVCRGFARALKQAMLDTGLPTGTLHNEQPREPASEEDGE